MTFNGLKIVVFLSLAGGFPAFGATCYQAYEQGFRNAVGQNNPKQIIDEYHECLRLDETRQQQDRAAQQFRAQQSGHGGSRPQGSSEDAATEVKVAARPIIPPAVRQYDPISLSVSERPTPASQIPAECIGGRYNYVAADGTTTCPAAANNAQVAVTQFRQNRDRQIRGFLNELARND